MTEKEHIRELLVKLTGILAVCFLLLAVVMGVVFLLHYSRYLGLDPGPDMRMEKTLSEMRESGFENQEVLDLYRNLHYYSRRGFFLSEAFVERGRILLAASLGLFFLCIRLRRILKTRIPGTAVREETPSGFKTVLIGGVIITGTALSVSLLPLWRIPTGREVKTGIALAPQLADDLRRNWPGFRGPGGGGVFRQVDFPLEPVLLWSRELDFSGMSSPIVWEDRIYLTGHRDRKLILAAFATENGEPIWERPVKSRSADDDPDGSAGGVGHDAAGPEDDNSDAGAGSVTSDDPIADGGVSNLPEVTEDTGFAAPTPACDANGVYTLFANNLLTAFDHNGNLRWQIQNPVPDNPYGHASSLLVYNGMLFLQLDHRGPSSLKALDTFDGGLIWEIPRHAELSWASPVLCEHSHGVQLILVGNPAITAYNPKSGEQLWVTEALQGEVAVSAAYCGDSVFVANEFAQLASLNSRTGTIQWSSREILPQVASPVVAEGRLYILASYGAFSCTDSESGEIIWIHEEEEEQGWYSSPLILGDNLISVSRYGVLLIQALGDVYTPLFKTDLGVSVNATPAYNNGRMIIRGEGILFCFGGEGNGGETGEGPEQGGGEGTENGA